MEVVICVLFQLRKKKSTYYIVIIFEDKQDREV